MSGELPSGPAASAQAPRIRDLVETSENWWLRPASATALRTIRARDRRLSPYGHYRAVLDDEALRGTIEGLLAGAAGGVAGAAVRAEDGRQASSTSEEQQG